MKRTWLKSFFALILGASLTQCGLINHESSKPNTISGINADGCARYVMMNGLSSATTCSDTNRSVVHCSRNGKNWSAYIVDYCDGATCTGSGGGGATCANGHTIWGDDGEGVSYYYTCNRERNEITKWGEGGVIISTSGCLRGSVCVPGKSTCQDGSGHPKY